MEFSFGTLELNRTSSSHLGTAAVHNPLEIKGLKKQAEAKPAKGAFESFLREAVEGMNAQQVQVSKINEQIITDPDSVDIHDATISMAKAQMALNLAHTVIERLISGWTELSQNR
ncbi:MAG: flagellar hook-basal body complex protein FliE [Treponema sp.]|nr:flagellar hook-basal body complex protein FliE [Treponema sp.]